MLSRKEALDILELDNRASSYDIENRYTMLIKRYHGQQGPEIAEKLTRITLAYDILTGRYVEPEPEDPRLEQVVLGKTRRQWANLWHYGRWPLLIGMIAIAFVTYLLYTIATNKPPDFQVAAVGRIFRLESEDPRLEQFVRKQDPALNEIGFELLPLDLRDPFAPPTPGVTPPQINAQENAAYMMKFTAKLAAENIDIFIVDRMVYDRYAGQGIFQPLSEALLAQIDALPSDLRDSVRLLRRRPVEDNGEEIDLNNPPPLPTEDEYEAMNRDTSLPITGLDVSELQLIEGLGLYSNEQILTIGHRAGKPELAATVLLRLIEARDEMHASRKAFEDQLRAQYTTTVKTATPGTTAAGN